jgi:hypothetical protein
MSLIIEEKKRKPPVKARPGQETKRNRKGIAGEVPCRFLVLE